MMIANVIDDVLVTTQLLAAALRYVAEIATSS